MGEATKAHLHRQLVKLGDMMGDGLHLEPDGKWISKEYKQGAKRAKCQSCGGLWQLLK